MKKTIGFLLAAIVLVIAAIYTSNSGRTKTQNSENGKPLLPGLSKALGDGTFCSVSISTAVDSVSIDLKDGEWKIKELYGYPADFEKIRRLSIAASDAVVGQTMATMKIDTPEKILRFIKNDGSDAATLYFGEHRESQTESASPWSVPSGGIYVSRNKEGPVFLVRDSFFEADGSPAKWADTRIYKDDITNVKNVRIIHSDGDSAELTVDESGEMTLLGKIRKNAEFNKSKSYGLRNGLSRINFTAIANPEIDEDILGFSTGVVYSAETSDGVVYTATFGAESISPSGRYARFKVSASNQSSGKSLDNKSKDITVETTLQKAERQNKDVSVWTYIVPELSAKQFTPHRADLISPKEK